MSLLLTKPPLQNSSGVPVMLLLQVGGRGLESFCAVHVRERGKEDLRPKKAINRTSAARTKKDFRRARSCI